jgi:hypothetical protein
MKAITRLTMMVGVLALCACAGQYGGDTVATSGQKAGQVDCSTVRCAACPEGQTPVLRPPDCCRCVPIDDKIKDCSNVRCAACPEGQHPKLTPPDCCRCVPD